MSAAWLVLIVAIPGGASQAFPVLYGLFPYTTCGLVIVAGLGWSRCIHGSGWRWYVFIDVVLQVGGADIALATVYELCVLMPLMYGALRSR